MPKMSTIVYSVNGEGRGHATRVQAIIEMLVPDHRFVLLASEDAYEHFRTEYSNHPWVKVSRLPGMRFKYRNGKLCYLSSVLGSLPFLCNIRKHVGSIQKLLHQVRPDLAITDFEPLLPRAAQRCRIPWLSLDHQHFLSVSDFRGIPWKLRWQSRFLRCSIGMFYRGQSGEAVSSFSHLPSREGCQHVERIGVLIRKKIQEYRPQISNEGHLVVYVRGEAPDSFWEALSKVDRTIYAFGKSVPPVTKNIEFFGIQNDQFIRCLAKSDALITTAGNQLVGEAMYLGKPVFALPEQGNFEQGVNGWLVSQTQAGWSIPIDQVSPHVLEQFLLSLPLMRKRLETFDCFGNDRARAFIEKHLPKSSLQTDSREVPSQRVA
jgi:uncharacterized protein (TIGR00661 family)